MGKKHISQAEKNMKNAIIDLTEKDLALYFINLIYRFENSRNMVSNSVRMT